MKILFFGTPPFAAEALRYLVENGVKIAAVVTRPDKPVGRSKELVPPAVKKMAAEILPDVPILQPRPASSPESIRILEQVDADLFVVVAYGEILKQEVLDIPPEGCINLHASLLPKYRGAAPIQRAIIDGERETGVTIIRMALKMDAGDMLKTVSTPIEKNETFGELQARLCRIGSEALLETIRAIESGEVKEAGQDHEQATFAPKIETKHCEIDWSGSAEKIHNLIRGVNPYPGAWCSVTVGNRQKRLKFLRTEPVAADVPAGEFARDEQGDWLIGCGKGALKVLELQLEGKKAMPPDTLFRGISLKVE